MSKSCAKCGVVLQHTDNEKKALQAKKDKALNYYCYECGFWVEVDLWVDELSSASQQ